MPKSLPFVLLLAFFLFGCTTSGVPQTGTNDQKKRNIVEGENKLPSGRTIFVNNISKVDFPQGPSAMVLSYKTSIQIDKMKDLRAEADEIWALFVKDVEQAGLKAAALRAVHDDNQGIIQTGKGYGFVIEKRADGAWHWLDDDKK